MTSVNEKAFFLEHHGSHRSLSNGAFNMDCFETPTSANLFKFKNPNPADKNFTSISGNMMRLKQNSSFKKVREKQPASTFSAMNMQYCVEQNSQTPKT